MAGSSLLKHLRIGLKLPLVTVLITALALFFGKVIATGHARSALTDAGEERLLAVAESRAEELVAALESTASNLIASQANPVIGDAVRSFVTGWEILGPWAAERVRESYLHKNPHPPGARYLFEDSGDRSPYSFTHRRYHPYFKSIMTGLGYADILLISGEGVVVHSTAKTGYLGEALREGRAATSPLASAYLAAIAAPADDPVVMTDFIFDPIVPGDLVAVFATALRSPAGELRGVLAVTVSEALLNGIMQRPEGLGETGQAFLIGATGGLRSEPRLYVDPVLRQGIDPAPPLRAVQNGQRGVLRHLDDNGNAVFTAFVPARVSGNEFAVMAQQSEAEILSPAREMGARINEDGVLGIVIMSMIGLIFARSMSVPLTRVDEAMQRVAQKNYEAEIPDRKRRDEIGAIARRLDAFQATLVEADSLARENAFKGAAFEAASAALMLVDRELTIIYVNDELIRLLERHQVALGRLVPDFRPDALPGRSLLSFVPQAGLGGGGSAQAAPPSTRFRVGQQHFSIDTAPVESEGGSVIGYVVEWRDVSAEEMDRALLSAVERNLPVASFATDGRLLSANANFAHWIGMPGAELPGLRWDRLFTASGMAHEAEEDDATEDDAMNWERTVKRAASDPSIPVAPKSRPSKAGQVMLRPVGNPAGRVERYVLLCFGECPSPAVAALEPGNRLHAGTAAGVSRLPLGLSHDEDVTAFGGQR